MSDEGLVFVISRAALLLRPAGGVNHPDSVLANSSWQATSQKSTSMTRRQFS